MNPIFESGFWGFVSGGALVIGAAVGYFARVPGTGVAGVMAFGSGVLISALSFELMEEAFEQAGLTASATGFLLGAAIYAVANRILAIWGAKHRKRSGTQQPSEGDQAGSGAAMRARPSASAAAGGGASKPPIRQRQPPPPPPPINWLLVGLVGGVVGIVITVIVVVYFVRFRKRT